MSRSFPLMIDAGFAAHGPSPSSIEDERFFSLMQDDGEYVRAIGRLFLTPPGNAGEGIPDEVVLHLYSYEILERMRDTMTATDLSGDEVLVLPFWPGSLFQAAGIAANAADEIEEMFVPASGTCYARRSRNVIEAEAIRVLGELRFEPHDYIDAMESLASRAAWTVIDA